MVMLRCKAAQQLKLYFDHGILLQQISSNYDNDQIITHYSKKATNPEGDCFLH